MFGSIYLTVIAFGLIASLLYLLFDKKTVHPTQRIFLGILSIVLILETVGLLTARQRINNSIGYNIGFIYLESLLLIGYFYFMEKNLFFRKIILMVTLFIAVWAMVVSVQLQDIRTVFQYFAFLPFGLFILFLSGRLLGQILNLRMFADWDLLLLPHFWISTAIIFFYLEALLIFGAYQFDPEFVVANVRVLFGFNRFIAGTMYFVFGIAFFIPLIYERFLQKKQLN